MSDKASTSVKNDKKEDTKLDKDEKESVKSGKHSEAASIDDKKDTHSEKSQKSDKGDKDFEPEKTESPRNKEAERQAELFEKYLEDSGLTVAFQIIFAEIISKKVDPSQVFTYTAMRLRQIGAELNPLLPDSLKAIGNANEE
mmetsp:Transcript_11337/g.12466  ORF Transcript_11337/g.12466 Transcript_11337/m.12466 type:complete len:142 (-) Transcript_11337:235-660(-)